MLKRLHAMFILLGHSWGSERLRHLPKVAQSCIPNWPRTPDRPLHFLPSSGRTGLGRCIILGKYAVEAEAEGYLGLTDWSTWLNQGSRSQLETQFQNNDKLIRCVTPEEEQLKLTFGSATCLHAFTHTPLHPSFPHIQPLTDGARRILNPRIS